ncbi:hypothetical protein [Arthrobacter sp. EM1]|uniref:hypothetical protein n=1 Tax=Arthrobacter sp. EM1 TaxID=3043847 RepID=UPI0032B7402A
MLSELGVSAGQTLTAAMHALGMYLVGVGELITPDPEGSPASGEGGGPAISAKVYPEGFSSLVPGSYALAAPA